MGSRCQEKTSPCMLMSLLLMLTPSTRPSGGSGQFDLLLHHLQSKPCQGGDPTRGRSSRGQQRAEEDAAEGACPVERDPAGGRDGQVHQLRGHGPQVVAVPGQGQRDKQRDVWDVRGHGPHDRGLQGTSDRGLATAGGQWWRSVCRGAQDGPGIHESHGRTW